MARIRTIKPEFFDDEDIAAMSFPARLAFIGLWQQADREGRLKDRPVRLKARIFPFDDLDMDDLLNEIARHGFIQRYRVGDLGLIQVRTFAQHQQVGTRETGSVLPPCDDEKGEKHVQVHAQARTEHVPEHDGREGKGKEGNGKGTEEIAEPQGDSSPPPADLVSLWNQLVTPPIPQVTKLTPDRARKITARLKVYPDLAMWRTVIAWINTQEWMRASGTGEHPNWTATLDWLCKSDGQVVKCLERAQTAQPQRPASGGARLPTWAAKARGLA